MNIRSFIKEYYPSNEELLEFLECEGHIELDREIVSSIDLARNLLEQMRPYQIMYDVCMLQLEKLLTKELEDRLNKEFIDEIIWG